MLVRPGNSMEIADAIRYYIEHPGAIKAQGDKAFARVKDFFSRKGFRGFGKDLQLTYKCITHKPNV